MTFETIGDGTLDYFPCRYGKSRLVFRGPRRDLTGEYVAFLGATETYGKFIPQPFPDLIEAQTGLRVVNFGLANAGIDVFVNDTTIMLAAAAAQATVVQIMGANNLTNRFYSVHPRRNDRFLKASQLMQTIFREVDFTEFHFTRHMLGTLATVAPERFRLVVDEVQQAWLSRMQLMLGKIGGKVVLLWFADHAPDEKLDIAQTANDPFAIERWMIEKLRPRVAEVVEVTPGAAILARGCDGMVYGPLEAPAAQGMLGPAAHDAVADKLAPVLRALLGEGPDSKRPAD